MQKNIHYIYLYLNNAIFLFSRHVYLVHLIISSHDRMVFWCGLCFPAKQTRILKKVVQKQIIFILKFFLYAYKVPVQWSNRAPSTKNAEIGHCRVGCRVVGSDGT